MKNGPKEEWRRVQAPYECGRGYYEVSNYGNIRHVYKRCIRRVKPLARHNTHGGAYMYVRLNTIEKRIEMKLARAVWTAFKEPIPEGMCIVHRNGMWTDNALWNLELKHREEMGALYGATAGRRYARLLKGEHYGDRAYRMVARIDREGNVLKWYRSARDAAKDNALINYQAILDRLNHRLKREADIWVLGTSYVWENEVNYGEEE